MVQRRTDPERENSHRGWSRFINKENILVIAGLALVLATFIGAEQGKPFHYEFLVLAGGMMGLGAVSIGDRKK